MTTRLRAPQVALLLFCSGFCALIYQTVWLREFRLIFGASTAASAAVLGIFMGGLGLGSAFLGKRAERSPKPLMMYGNLELWIALFAALSPLMLLGVRWLYASTGGTMVLGTFLGTVVRLIMAAVVLVGPTYLMGGTLPAAARSVASDSDQSRRSLAFLYGINTMGAVTGTLISTFWLVEVMGNRASLWLGCGLNVIVALIARSMSRNSSESVPVTAVEASTQEAPESGAGFKLAPLVIFASAIVGFAFMLMELVWYRMLAPILGGSTFTFGLILAIALLGIGLGGLAYALRGADRAVTIRGFAWTCALEALLIVIPYALGDRLALTALLTRHFGTLGFAAQVIGWGGITAIAVLPAAVVAGYQFPMLIALLGQGRSGVARHVGIAYAANTLGAIVGSLAGGFGLMPLFSAPGLWIAVTVILAILSLIAAFWNRKHCGTPAWAPMAISLAALALLLTEGPTSVWRHGGIGAGRADNMFVDTNGATRWKNSTRRNIVWEAEGIESSVALTSSQGLAFVVNGKVDGHSRGDSGTQVMGGLIPALLHPTPRTALIVGLGTGSTAGWLASLPNIERVDVVELEPAILEVARQCAPVNKNVLSNPKVRIHLGDAREVLITTPERYDIIFSEPSNPYRAGVASLFTLDFYQSAKQRLAPGGIFAQWVQAYEVQNETVHTVIGTVASAFPNVQTWWTQRADLILVASDTPIVVDAEQLKARASESAMKEALFNAWRVSTVEGILSHFMANEAMARKILESGPEISTDDRNPLEYGFARGVGKRRVSLVSGQLANYSVQNGFNRPTSVRGDINWDRVNSMIPVSEALDGKTPKTSPSETANQKSWRQVCELFLASEYDQALKVARDGKLAAVDPMEIEILAECAVFSKDPSAAEWIEKVSVIYPPGAALLRGCATASRNEWVAALEEFSVAFATFHKDPWVRQAFLGNALKVAHRIAIQAKSPQSTRKLFDTLGQPFAVDMLREQRERVRLNIARFTDANPVNSQYREALDPFAIFPMWEREFLNNRLMIYRSTRDERAGAAEIDYATFLENELRSFDEALKGGRGPLTLSNNDQTSLTTPDKSKSESD